jgi:glycosyltransferase involved in cell wall biosynthesis
MIPWPATRNPGPRVVGETARLARIIAKARPDVVHLHSSKAGLAGRLALRGRLPTVFQPHGWSFEAVEGPLLRVVIAWERAAARWADAVICVSEAERERGVAVGIEAPWAVIPTGIDLRAFPAASDEERAAARAKLGVAADFLVVCVGRLSRAKGQDVLLQAWPRVGAAVPGAELVLVGDGPERADLERLAGSGARLVGEQDDIHTWLAAADVVAVPSRWEAMSLVMLEAMSTARSVVATDVAGVREAFGEGWSAIVPVGDRRALADALVQRLLDPQLAAAEGAAARRRAEQAYDAPRATEAIAAVYERIRHPREP